MLWRQGQQELLLDLILGKEPGSAPGLCQQVLAMVDAATRDPSGEEDTALGLPLFNILVLVECWLLIPPSLYTFAPPGALEAFPRRQFVLWAIACQPGQEDVHASTS